MYDTSDKSCWSITLWAVIAAVAIAFVGSTVFGVDLGSNVATASAGSL